VNIGFITETATSYPGATGQVPAAPRREQT
jgi:hypothetical protein